MTEFTSKRITHEYTQINTAPAERVFPLLCPVREADWIPGWKYQLVYSQSGVAEAGCVFTTPNEDGSENTWTVTEYDPGGLLISFVWINPGTMAAQIGITLERRSEETKAHIRYTYTGLSAEGNREIERYDKAWFDQKMQNWEAAINHYLRTGKRIHGGGGE